MNRSLQRLWIWLITLNVKTAYPPAAALVQSLMRSTKKKTTVFYPKYPCYSRSCHLPKIAILHDFTAKLRHLPWLFMCKWLLRFLKGFQFWIGLGSPELVCTLHALSSKLLQFEDCQQLLLTSAEAAAWQECTEVKVGSLPTISSGSCELEVYWCNCSPPQHQHSQRSPDNGPNTLAGAAQTPKEWDS